MKKPAKYMMTKKNFLREQTADDGEPRAQPERAGQRRRASDDRVDGEAET